MYLLSILVKKKNIKHSLMKVIKNIKMGTKIFFVSGIKYASEEHFSSGRDKKICVDR